MHKFIQKVSLTKQSDMTGLKLKVTHYVHSLINSGSLTVSDWLLTNPKIECSLLGVKARRILAGGGRGRKASRNGNKYFMRRKGIEGRYWYYTRKTFCLESGGVWEEVCGEVEKINIQADGKSREKIWRNILVTIMLYERYPWKSIIQNNLSVVHVGNGERVSFFSRYYYDVCGFSLVIFDRWLSLW